jgi:hypothetical protein
MEWILQKEKEGDDFQAWHQDLALSHRIFKTIVVNLGIEAMTKKNKPVQSLNLELEPEDV